MSTALHTPAAIRDAARQLRAAALGAVLAEGGEPTVDLLIDAALVLRNLDVIRCLPGSVELRGDRGKVDHGRGVILIDETLTDEQRRFTVPHEIGHAVLEESEADCEGMALDTAPTTETFPLGEAYVTGYSPRQRAEVNASLFAAEFVAPLDTLRHEFLSGRSASEIAAELGVSMTVVYGQLTAAFLSADATVAGRAGESIAETPEVFDLHPQQQKARDAAPGPTAVDAGPGTGKTRTLTERVVRLVRDQKVPPEQILCLTFSNKAAEELRGRCELALGAAGRQVRAQTFHAFGLDLLRDYPEQADVRNDVTLLDTIDAEELLDRHLVELGLDEYRNVGEPAFYLRPLLDAISRAKDEMVSPERYAELAAAAASAAGDDEKKKKAARRSAEVARVYRTYEDLLREHGAVDFGDLVYRVVRLFEDHPEVAAEVAALYPNVLVDEYQDVNRASARLLQHLCPDGQGLWVVGDVRQAIYRFRGASPLNLGEFQRDFPGAGEPVPLVRNYRSAPHLLKVFSSAAARVRGSTGFAGWDPHRKDAVGRATFCIADDESAELHGIAERIAASIAAGRPARAHAVLCHRNADVQLVARALEERGVPVASFGGFFERTEVLDLLSLLAYVAEYGATALPRVTRNGPHALSATDRQAVLAAALEREGGLPAVFQAGEAPAGMSADAFARAAADWRFLSELGFRREVWTFFAGYLFEDGRYLREMSVEGGAAARARLLAVGQLLLMARAFDAREEKAVPRAKQPGDPATAPDLDGADDLVPRPEAAGVVRKRGFLRFMRRLWASRDRRVPVPVGALDAVHVGTVHGAKGLEFPVVFVPFLAEGRFPFKAPNDFTPPPPGMLPDDPDADEAELDALFFVAMTRARDTLVLSHAASYDGKPAKPSRLLRLVEQARVDGLFEEARWITPATVGAAEGTTLEPQTPDSLRLTELEAYLDCPRRYYYRHVLNLPEPDSGRAYLRYLGACRTTLDWLDERHRADTYPATWEEIDARFSDDWRARGPLDHDHEGFYRHEALEAVRCEWERRLTQEPAPQWATAASGLLRGTIEGVPVTVPVAMSRDEGGVVRLGHRYFRPRKDKDHLEHRHALLRHALTEQADGRTVVLEARYPDEVVELKVPTKTVEKSAERRRLDDLGAAVRGIREGLFPAEPAEDRDRECPRCPYGLVCPS